MALGIALSNPVFDQPMLAWIGFMTHKPLTEDYVPLFPWLGFTLIGFAMTDIVRRKRPEMLSRSPNFPRVMTWAGRHSLAIYLLHQPILLGVLFLATRILRSPA